MYPYEFKIRCTYSDVDYITNTFEVYQVRDKLQFEYNPRDFILTIRSKTLWDLKFIDDTIGIYFKKVGE